MEGGFARSGATTGLLMAAFMLNRKVAICSGEGEEAEDRKLQSLDPDGRPI